MKIPTSDLFSFFSQDRFSCLDYHDDSQLDHSQRETIVEEVSDIIYLFLQSINYVHTIPPEDPHMRKALWVWAETEFTKATGREMRGALEVVLEEAATCAESFYPLSSFEVKLHMAIGTALVISVDSHIVAPHINATLARGHCRYMAGLNPENAWFSVFREHLKEAADIFGACNPLIGTLSSAGWLRFVDGFCMEDELWKMAQLSGEPDAPSQFKVCLVEDYPAYMRHITGTQIAFYVPVFKPTRGIEVPYAMWMSYAPALNVIINIGNDLFSYPKEVLDCEKVNYLTMLTKTQRSAGISSQFTEGLWTFRDSIYETFSRVYESVKALDDAFTLDSQKVDKNTSGISLYDFQLGATMVALFKQGYFAWHVNCTRYRLDSLKARLARELYGEE